MSMLSPTFVALCRVQAKSLAELADSVGSSKSIFLAALAGRRPFPDHRILSLKREIGLDDEGKLDDGRLHHWKVRDVADLNLVVESRFSGASMMQIEHTGQTDVALPVLYLFQGVAKTTWTVVYATVRGLDAATLELVTGLVSLSDERLKVERLDCWDRGQNDLAPVKAMLANRSKEIRSWADVIQLARGLGLTPSDAWARLNSERG